MRTLALHKHLTRAMVELWLSVYILLMILTLSSLVLYTYVHRIKFEHVHWNLQMKYSQQTYRDSPRDISKKFQKDLEHYKQQPSKAQYKSSFQKPIIKNIIALLMVELKKSRAQHSMPQSYKLLKHTLEVDQIIHSTTPLEISPITSYGFLFGDSSQTPSSKVSLNTKTRIASGGFQINKVRASQGLIKSFKHSFKNMTSSGQLLKQGLWQESLHKTQYPITVPLQLLAEYQIWKSLSRGNSPLFDKVFKKIGIGSFPKNHKMFEQSMFMDQRNQEKP